MTEATHRAVESVWDYPRPPALVTCDSLVEVKAAHRVIASTSGALRLLETASPPAYYIPPQDVDFTQLVRTADTSYCEWKGQASYYDLQVQDKVAPRVAWTYHWPTPSFASIKDHLSFYAGPMDACRVDGDDVEQVRFGIAM